MRIIKKHIVAKDASGKVVVQADDLEDMYHLYNLVNENDTVMASTTRNVVRESSSGSVVKQRVKLNIQITVTKVDYDAEQCSLRLSGRNSLENDFIKMGQYHTLDVELGQPFTIEKDCWDWLHLERLQDACDPGKKAEVAGVVMQEGLAHVCLVTTMTTVTKLRLERKMPKKSQDNFSKAMEKFFEEIYNGIKKHVDFSVVKALLIGSPGFLKDDFMKYFLTHSMQLEDGLLKQRAKIVLAHASSGHKRAVEQLIANPDMSTILANVKATEDVKALTEFYSVLAEDADRACYGFDATLYADSQLAIGTLLVTDKLFQAAEFTVRRKYITLVESVKNNGGKVYVLSSQHTSGEQLDQYTGVAAILRFPLLEEESDGDD